MPEVLRVPRMALPMRLLLALLLGYALFGRSFAHLGIPPLYVGELVLGIVGFAALFTLRGWPVLLQPTMLFLFLFLLWCLFRTIPYIAVHGMDTLRDAALWGYALFALFTALYFSARPEHLRLLLPLFHRFGVLFLYVVSAELLVRAFFRDSLPALHDGAVPLISLKPGDVLVHLAALFAGVAGGIIARPSPAWWLAFALCFLLTATVGRAGLAAFLAASAFILAQCYRSRQLWRVAAAFTVMLALLGGTTMASGALEGKHESRDYSLTQIGRNVASLFTDGHEWGLEGTKRYRLEWWERIIGYTFGGEYFLTGKGFGINLADDDGFQVRDDASLRSPHNVHLTVLARTGVPGFMLWVALQLAYAGSLIVALFHARACGYRRWQALFLLLIAYWLAMLVNASFDPYLEGPMGGIWFWSVMGVGLAARHAYRYRREVLA